jgi:uncharacterized Tic20 family protein
MRFTQCDQSWVRLGYVVTSYSFLVYCSYVRILSKYLLISILLMVHNEVVPFISCVVCKIHEYEGQSKRVFMCSRITYMLYGLGS